MEGKHSMNIFKGVLRAIIATMILTIIFALIMSFREFSVKSSNIVYVLITCLSLVVGATYAAKINEKKGWLIGLSVGACYYLVLLVISSIFNGTLNLSIFDLYKLLISLTIGVLSGMLGINV